MSRRSVNGLRRFFCRFFSGEFLSNAPHCPLSGSVPAPGQPPAAEVFQRRGGDEGFQGLPIAVLQALADGGGADSLSPGLFTGHNDAVDARLGQLLFHDLIVQARHLAGRLLAHIAGGHVQYRRDLGKNGQVKPCVALDHGGFVFQEITRERGVGDDIGAAVVQDHIAGGPPPLPPVFYGPQRAPDWRPR